MSFADHPGKCYFQDDQVAVSPGESFDVPGKCMQYVCQPNFTYHRLTCVLKKKMLSSDEGRKLRAGDPTKSFPECCPNYSNAVESVNTKEEESKLISGYQ